MLKNRYRMYWSIGNKCLVEENIPVECNFGVVENNWEVSGIRVVIKVGVNCDVSMEDVWKFVDSSCDDWILLVNLVDSRIIDVVGTLFVVINEFKSSCKVSIWSSMLSLISMREVFNDARSDNSASLHESIEALEIVDASDSNSSILEIWLAIELNCVTNSMKSEQDVLDVFLEEIDSIVVVTSSIASDICWRVVIFSMTSFLLGGSVARTVDNASVKDVLPWKRFIDYNNK